MTTICFLFNPILWAECEGSVTPSQTASNSVGAPVDTQTSFILLSHTLAHLKLP